MKRALLLGTLLSAATLSALAQQEAAAPATNTPNVPLKCTHVTAPIVIDGDLSDAGWQQAERIDKWYETNPGDNIEPKAKSVGYLAYDDRFFYAGFDFQDPAPGQIKGAFNDRDSINGNTDDYAGVILDTRNDGKTGILFLANAHGIQYDAVSDDTSGNEDSAPDFFWDSAAKITPTGWQLEIRIPFSSLRYKKAEVQQWGIMLYRNWPRDRRYQMFANRLPRGNNCFICNRNPLVGLQNLPEGGHLVTAPYVSARQLGEVTDGLGSEFVNHNLGGNAGLDLKWTPTADTALDGTINPDFSQVESDVAVIETNERFAIFFPEKRPFFLEGVELFSTPLQVVYTRTITSPRWGMRSTGKFAENAYTLLIAQDRGGGSVILPSATGSDFADQEFQSTVAIGRVRRDFGKNSFISFLGTTREVRGSGHNRVFGPDFQWKTEHNTLTGQLLMGDTLTPNRPDLSSKWTGQKLRSHAGYLWWSRSTKTWDFYSEYKDIGKDFRADNGFIPQVGFRENYSEIGYTFRPKGFFSRIRPFTMAEYDTKQDGGMLYRLLSCGFNADGKHRLFMRFRYAYENILSGERVFQRHQLLYSTSIAVNNVLTQLTADGWFGQDVDFTNNRLGNGMNISLGGTLRPTDHLDIRLTAAQRFLNIANDTLARKDRLFTSQVQRIRATYTFNNRMFARAIVQNTRTNRDINLYGPDFVQHGGNLSTQLLFAYKLNWQTVMYVGLGDLRGVTAEEGEFARDNRQVFAKVSYAFQR
ncbi:MAG TPA: DUF5916 domain-containing protein [Thermoanaerobaculia bacterium]|nr:DUF5916 domain-containing protein [Thermoanaerobaculia bacterium]